MWEILSGGLIGTIGGIATKWLDISLTKQKIQAETELAKVRIAEEAEKTERVKEQTLQMAMKLEAKEGGAVARFLRSIIRPALTALYAYYGFVLTQAVVTYAALEASTLWTETQATKIMDVQLFLLTSVTAFWFGSRASSR